MMKGKCIGYVATGNVCGRPAEIIDEQAGGLLCAECAAAKGAHRRERETVPTRGEEHA